MSLSNVGSEGKFLTVRLAAFRKAGGEEIAMKELLLEEALQAKTHRPMEPPTYVGRPKNTFPGP